MSWSLSMYDRREASDQAGVVLEEDGVGISVAGESLMDEVVRSEPGTCVSSSMGVSIGVTGNAPGAWSTEPGRFEYVSSTRAGGLCRGGLKSFSAVGSGETCIGESRFGRPICCDSLSGDMLR